MAKEVALRRNLPARRRWVFEKNTMGFPRALREAIPDHATSIGRVLNRSFLASQEQLTAPK